MSPSSTPSSVLLLGNPNSGKTTLFNALTGLSAKTGNYPGITVEHREGTARLPSGRAVTVVDVPGTYALAPHSDDEAVAVRALLADLPSTGRADVVVAVVDSTALQRNLYLTAQLRELPLPLVVALTMTDVVASDGGRVNAALLSDRLGVPVVIAADLPALLDTTLSAQAPLALAHNAPKIDDSAAGLAAVIAAARAAGTAIAAKVGLAGADLALGLVALQRTLTTTETAMPAIDAHTTALRALPRADRHEVCARVVQARQARARDLAKDIVTTAAPSTTRAATETRSEAVTRRIDAVALHPLLGPLVLVSVFGLLFQALFSWAEPIMTLIEDGLAAVTDVVAARLPASLPLFSSLITDGVLAGVGNVLVFVPQIAILFFFLAVLEDTGYLARAAFLLDRLMARVGLHGRAFVPMLSGFACAVPAILATRTIERTKDRLVTILVLPLISCSARLPIYSLMIATAFSGTARVFGVVEAGAVVMLSMYALSIASALILAAIFKRTLLRSATPPLVLELPPYRLPKAVQLYKAVSSRVLTFVRDAGTVILAITVVLWALLTFPRDDELTAARDKAVAATEASMPAGQERDEEVRAIKAQAGQALVERSAAGRFGHAIEPLLTPLGFDWKIGVGIIASFAAREVFVSTLGVVYGLGDAEDETSTSLRASMQKDTRADGSPLYTPLTGLSLLVFFLFAMQCMSTIAAVKRETRSWRWPLFQIAYMTTLAVLASIVVFQGGRLAGLQ